MPVVDVDGVELDGVDVEGVVGGLAYHYTACRATACQQECYQEAFDDERDRFASGEGLANTVVEWCEDFACLEDTTGAKMLANADAAIGVEHRAIATTEEHTFAGEGVDSLLEVSSWVLGGVGDMFAVD